MNKTAGNTSIRMIFFSEFLFDAFILSTKRVLKSFLDYFTLRVQNCFKITL